MPSKFEEKTAIVTGAASGIGRRTAIQFASEGANVVVADIDPEKGQETVARIEDDGGVAMFIETDVSEPASVAEMVKQAKETYGSVDIAHNNAGIGGTNRSLAVEEPEQWDRTIDINLKGVWLSLKYELAAMEETGGAIVNTASIAGLTAAGSAAYVASKHGVIGLTRVAATEYADVGIRVNAVCPGIVDTPLVRPANQESKATVEQYVNRQAIQRKATPDEIASTVVWLCSKDASFVTGGAYPVDGGYLAR